MENLIRRVLKEEINDKMINLLKRRFDVSQYNEIHEFLYELGYSHKEIVNTYSIFFKLETNLEFNPLNWMTYTYNADNLETIMNPNEPNIIYYRKNGKAIMEQNNLTKDFWFDYTEIWSFFGYIFELRSPEIQDILKIWLEETLNLSGYKPVLSLYFS
jgi:hypothetical protein